MPISVSCTGCDKSLRVSESKSGKRVKCPSCGEVFRVPDQDDEDIFEADVVDAPVAPRRTKRRGKKKSPLSNQLVTTVVIGVVIALLAGIGINLAMKRSAAIAVPATSPLTEQVANVTTISPSVDRVRSATSGEGSIASQQTLVTSPVQNPIPAEKMDSRGDDEARTTPESLSASDEFFMSGAIPELRIEISDSEMEKLMDGPRTFVIGSPRPYVHGTIRENGKTTYNNVAIKLKGSAGSFRPVDDRPALSIGVSKYEKDQTFHGLSKFHLNNSVQDDTYLHEWLCHELFSAAKLPATRVSHARVWLNDRDLGLYVLKSAFDKSFLHRHFAGAKGNLYEGGFVQDIDAELEKDSGKGTDDRSDLTALLAACRDSNAESRWERMEELLNVDQFISFMAMEMMVGHWDGYTLNHNNYRIYFDPKGDKAHFLPHGMDQVFGNPGASIIDFPSSIVGSAVMQNGEWRARYRKRVSDLLAIFSPTDNLVKLIEMGNDRLRPVLLNISSQAAKDHDDRVARLKERVIARVASLIQQQSQSDPVPREFDDNGRLILTDWYAVTESPDARLEVVEIPKGPKAYSIQCVGKGKSNASWRCKALLGKGTYLLHANIQSKQINAPDEKNIAVGAGLRVSGATRTNVRKGTVNWTPLEYEFTVQEDLRNVEFIAELRAKKGQVWFSTEGFYLTRK